MHQMVTLKVALKCDDDDDDDERRRVFSRSKISHQS